MTLSPCRNCPKRHQDKNLCLENCELIHRLQTLQYQYLESSCSSAVDAADENRYRIMSPFDLKLSGASSLSFL